MRRSLAVLAGAPLLTATSCINTFDLRTSPRPERVSPAIVARSGGRPANVRTLRVERCRPEVLPHVAWSIARLVGADSTAAPDSIIYGQLPRGYHELHPAEPLSPGGCYEMHGIAGSGDSTTFGDAVGSAAFRVLPDGTVVPGWTRVRYGKELGHAALACRFAFHRARTPADTAAVDARTFPVADTTVSCQMMRTTLAQTMRAEPGPRKVAVTMLTAVAEIGAIIWLGRAWDRARGLDH
jgi:hypothetical protein